MNLAVAEGVAGGADFCGEDLEDLEGQELVAGHEGKELFAGDVAEFGAGVGDGGEGIWLVADEAGKAEDGAGVRLEGEKLFALRGVHGEGCVAALEDVETVGIVALLEQDAEVVAHDGGGFWLESVEEFGIGVKCGGVESHVQSPGRGIWGGRVRLRGLSCSATHAHGCTGPVFRDVMLITY